MLNENCNTELAILELQDFYREYVSVSNTNLALIDNDIVGGINLNIASDEADIVFLFIVSKYRGIGYSKWLLTETFKYLKERNVKNLFLEVDTDNKIAIDLYTKAGFVEISRRKDYYSNGNDAILMKREL